MLHGPENIAFNPFLAQALINETTQGRKATLGDNSETKERKRLRALTEALMKGTAKKVETVNKAASGALSLDTQG